MWGVSAAPRSCCFLLSLPQSRSPASRPPSLCEDTSPLSARLPASKQQADGSPPVHVSLCPPLGALGPGQQRLMHRAHRVPPEDPAGASLRIKCPVESHGWPQGHACWGGVGQSVGVLRCSCALRGQKSRGAECPSVVSPTVPRCKKVSRIPHNT